jgi:hypothetical protein
METYNGIRGIFAFIKGYYDDVGTIKRICCASCGIKELVAVKTMNQRANKSTEYNWTTIPISELKGIPQLKVSNDELWRFSFLTGSS